MIGGRAAVFAVWIGVIMMHGEVGNAMSSNSKLTHYKHTSWPNILAGHVDCICSL